MAKTAYLPWKFSELQKFKEVLVVMKCICNSSKPGSVQSEMTVWLWDTTIRLWQSSCAKQHMLQLKKLLSEDSLFFISKAMQKIKKKEINQGLSYGEETLWRHLTSDTEGQSLTCRKGTLPRRQTLRRKISK